MSDELFDICDADRDERELLAESRRLDMAEIRNQLRNLQMAVERIEKALAPGKGTR